MSSNNRAFQGFGKPIDATRCAELQARYMQQWQELWDQAQRGALPPPQDRRFADAAW